MAQTLQTNFRVHSSATECLFVQHIMANLAKGGRAGVVIPEGVLFRGGPDQKVRKELLEQFNVHTILSLPAGCFLPYTGVKTNVIFFDRPKDGQAGRWHQKRLVLRADQRRFRAEADPQADGWQPDSRTFSPNGKNGSKATIPGPCPVDEIVERGYDLSAKNPNRKDDYEHRPALELVQSIKAKEERIMDLLSELRDHSGG